MPGKALILIDLQNEFLDREKGNFPIDESCRVRLLERLQTLVPAFRDGTMLDGQKKGDDRRLVVWVRSEYGEEPTDPKDTVCAAPSHAVENAPPSEEIDGGEGGDRDHFLHGTHTGRTPCCVSGSHGAEIYPQMKTLINYDEDLIITKRAFSTFTEEWAEQELRDMDEIYFAGLMSNVCVLASITDCLRKYPGRFKVGVVEDCLGYRREKSHERAMERIRNISIPMNLDEDQGTNNQVNVVQSSVFTIPKLYYVNGSIPSWRVMIALHEKGIDFQGIRMRVMSVPKPTRQPDFLYLNPRGKTPVFIDYSVPTDEALASDSDADAVEDVVNMRDLTCARSRTVINESLAVLRYLEDYYPSNKPLLPPLRQRALRAKVLALIQESENLHYTYDELEDAYWDAKNGAAEKKDPSIYTQFAEHVRPGLVQAVHRELEEWEKYLDFSLYMAERGQQQQTSRVVRRGGLRSRLRPLHDGNGGFLAGTTYMTLADCAFYPLLAYMIHRGLRIDELDEHGKKKWPAVAAYVEVMKGVESVAKSVPEGWEKPGKANVFSR
jgi:glutathione S-transferase/nicotinamidase-related amidase